MSMNIRSLDDQFYLQKNGPSKKGRKKVEVIHPRS